jgi:hypothetical protein
VFLFEVAILYNGFMPDENVPASKMENDDKIRLISLAEAADLYGFSRYYMSNLAKKGRLKAQKVGGAWITTPGDVEDYIRSRQERGAFRDDIQLD